MSDLTKGALCFLAGVAILFGTLSYCAYLETEVRLECLKQGHSASECLR
jgi:hypothetical protein